MKTETDNKQDDIQKTGAVRDCLTRLVSWIGCVMGIHEADESWVSEVEMFDEEYCGCKRCNREMYRELGSGEKWKPRSRKDEPILFG